MTETKFFELVKSTVRDYANKHLDKTDRKQITFDASNSDGSFKDELLWEFISEPFRLYIQDPNLLKKKSPEIFRLIEEVCCDR